MNELQSIAILGDCMDVMPKYRDKHFDLAIVDPPYFSGPEKRMFYGSKVSSRGVKRIDYPVTKTWDIPEDRYFKELLRISKNQIIWGCNYFDYKFPPGRIVWDKCNGESSFSDCEIAFCSFHDSVRLFRYMWNGMLQGKNILEGHKQQGNKRLNEKRIHPTQKPVALYNWLFSKYANSGDTILDTHLGSGSSRIAAYDAKLDFTGIELNEIYFLKEEKRFKEHTAQLQLF